MPKYQFTCEVEPQYLSEQSMPDEDIYAFAYTITVTNTGEVTAQLISRHWIVEDALGHVEEVKGLGVVGNQPLLRPGESFQYTSGTRLSTRSGSMRGSFFCVAEDGERFEAEVPVFALMAESGLGGEAPPRVLH
ncbi:Co2+/Mg2+ efflux protein ApaG [Hydrogenophaga sp. A37]|uniref:Co2+/Mg2+ efflux protein ApaG n=1 Tax=Hydrogenophaga sp. A37 TaxID=1945864 RepID=UPI0009879DB3|nr:Co2+/Mg2+ efflux protein ApaG [Hydrogenophaga sp. A37]OOG86421.1 Co2+/Mg2+ efflux protein ApaG [Hydrogenophaga sp. A37]